MVVGGEFAAESRLLFRDGISFFKMPLKPNVDHFLKDPRWAGCECDWAMLVV